MENGADLGYIPNLMPGYMAKQLKMDGREGEREGDTKTHPQAAKKSVKRSGFLLKLETFVLFKGHQQVSEQGD